MSSEEHKREPEPQDSREQGAEENSEVQEESPASFSWPGEDPGTAEEALEQQPGALVEEEPGVVAEEDELVAALEAELEDTRRERDEYLEAMRRLKAEFENSRKRQEKERARLLEMASERLVLDLLPVLDNLDRALEAGGDIREGVQATRDQLAIVLSREGLLPVTSDGQTFDPNVHEAVMSQHSEEHEEGTILQTFERGYLLKGKPIRPAKVVVAKQA